VDNRFGLVVSGTGAAASTVADRCRAAGWSVAILDELPYGGICQLRGCDPKKVLHRGGRGGGCGAAAAWQGHHVTTSDRFLELDQLPRRVFFIGDGYVSFEFAHLAARARAEVVVLDRGERPLKAFDPDLAAKLLERTRALGIDFRARAVVEAIQRTGAGLRITRRSMAAARRLIPTL